MENFNKKDYIMHNNITNFPSGSKPIISKKNNIHITVGKFVDKPMLVCMCSIYNNSILSEEYAIYFNSENNNQENKIKEFFISIVENFPKEYDNDFIRKYIESYGLKLIYKYRF